MSQASMPRQFVLKLYEGGCNHHMIYVTSSHLILTYLEVLPNNLGIRAGVFAKTSWWKPRAAEWRSQAQVRRIKPPRPTVSQAPQPACFQLPSVDKLDHQPPSPFQVKTTSPITSTPQTQLNPRAHPARERITQINTERDLAHAAANAIKTTAEPV